MLYGGMLLYGYVVRVARVDCGMLYGGMLLLLLLLLRRSTPPPEEKGTASFVNM